MFHALAPRWRAASLVLIGVLALSAATVRADPFEIVVLPDTEYYSQSYPAVFAGQTQWITAHKADENIVFVTHLGDTIKDPAVAGQWDAATGAMYRLDGQVPYAVCAGNHDLADAAGFVDRFGPTHFSSSSWYGGATADGLGSYQIFAAGGYQFLHLALPYYPDAATRAWALGVIEANPGKPTIISTHDYLDGSGRTAAGASIWDDLVKGHPQVFMTLNGHHGTDVANRLVSTDASGKQVLQMLSDYQDSTTSSGNNDTGYLRKIIFDPDKGTISVQTYSPTYAGKPFLHDHDNEFSYDAAFLPQVSGSALGPIFVTDAATCRAAGLAQGFDTSPGPAGTRLPLGWTAWQIPGNKGTFSAASHIGPAGIAAATSANQKLLIVAGPPTDNWSDQLANVPSASGQAIATNPGSNAAAVIQLKVTNGTGRPVTDVGLNYDLALLWPSPSDDGSELPGYSLFWSTTGGTAAADWAKVGEDTAAGSKVWDIAVPVALGPGADLYLRWADDNSQAVGAENVWALDNVHLTMNPFMPGDTNGDGVVDAADYFALKMYMGVNSGATWEQGDFNHDGGVDQADLALLEANFGRQAAGSPASVPEPGSLVLLCCAALAAIGRPLRHRRG